MTDNLVKQLREYAEQYGVSHVPNICDAAADRIEALEAALDVIASNNGLALSWMSTAPMPMERYRDNCYEMMNIARAALAGEK